VAKQVAAPRYFVCSYFGADFLVRSVNVGGLEISAKIGEYPELKNFVQSCAEIKPDVFIDIGANLGLYTCIVMRNKLAPRAILFEPDHRNRIHLRQSSHQRSARRRHCHQRSGAGRRTREIPAGAGPERDIGLSQILENTPAGEGYDVDIVRLDDLVALSGKTLAIKIDIERYERKALAGMARTLADNRGLVQIEVLEARDETVGLMSAAGFKLAQEFGPNLVFRKP